MRVVKLTVRLTPEEHREVLARARDARRPLSQFLLLAGLGAVIQPPPPAAPEINRKLYTDLGHVGANLNQIARWLNSGDFHMIGGDQLAAAILDLQEVVGEVRGRLLGRPEAGE